MAFLTPGLPISFEVDIWRVLTALPYYSSSMKRLDMSTKDETVSLFIRFISLVQG